MNDYTDHYGSHTDSTDGLFWPQPHTKQQGKVSPGKASSSQPPLPTSGQTPPTHISLNESAYFPALYKNAQGCLFRENLKEFQKHGDDSSHSEGHRP